MKKRLPYILNNKFNQNQLVMLMMAIPSELQTGIFLLIVVVLLWVVYMQLNRIGKELADLSERVDAVDLRSGKNKYKDFEEAVKAMVEAYITENWPKGKNGIISLNELKKQLEIDQYKKAIGELRDKIDISIAPKEIERAVIDSLQGQMQELFNTWQESIKYNLAEEIQILITHGKGEDNLGLVRTKIGYLEQMIPQGRFPNASIIKNYRHGRTYYMLLIDGTLGNKADLFLLNSTWKNIERFRSDPNNFIFPLFTLEAYDNDANLVIECKPAKMVRNGELWELHKKGELIFHAPVNLIK